MKNKRPQAPKMNGNREMALAFQELRRSNATVPQRNKARYNRNDDRRNRQNGYA